MIDAIGLALTDERVQCVEVAENPLRFIGPTEAVRDLGRVGRPQRVVVGEQARGRALLDERCGEIHAAAV